jgi:hypothetical protein
MDPDELARRLGALEQQFPRLLRCVQCGRRSDDDAHCWQGRLVIDKRLADGPIVALYCPACVDRLFGE